MVRISVMVRIGVMVNSFRDSILLVITRHTALLHVKTAGRICTS